MKKLLIFVSAIIFSITLAGCGIFDGGETDINPDDITCQAGYVLEGTDCVPEEDEPVTCPTGQVLDTDGETCIDEPNDTCPAGQHMDTATNQCVDDELECPTGYHVEDDACVPDEGTAMYRTLLIDEMIEEMGTNVSYLGAVMEDMEFAQGTEVSYELNFYVTEDVDETHYVQATVTDRYVDQMMKREVMLDVDGEVFNFMFYVETVATGVHVYIQPGAILQGIALDDPEVAERLEWIGFDSEWVVFEMDESLETMISMEVLQDMLVSMFFSEMGESFFYDAQLELEAELGFSLSQYGLDMGQLVDYLIEDDMTSFQADFDAINWEAIKLHLDYLYVAPNLYQILNERTADLVTAGYANAATEIAMLNTAVWNDTLEVMELLQQPWDETNGLNTMYGTEAFFAGVDETEMDAIIEVIIKPAIETEVFWALEELTEVDEDFAHDLKTAFEHYEYDYIQFMESMGYSPTDAQNMYTAVMAKFPGDYYFNVVAVYETLNQEDIDFLHHLNNVLAQRWFDPMYDDEMYYPYDRMFEALHNYYENESSVAYFLANHDDVLVSIGYDQAYIDQLEADLASMGLEEWYDSLPSDVLENIFDAYVYVFIDDLELAIADGEVPEFLVEGFFGNPHIEAILQNLIDDGEVLPFDQSVIAANMISIDFDAIVLETLNPMDLANAIYGGPADYAAFLAANQTMSPNIVAFLEIWAPTVEMVNPYMTYVDDILYAVDNLDMFADYIDPSYYTETSIVNVTSENTDDITLLVTMELDGIGAAQLFTDFSDDVNGFLAGFDNVPFPFNPDWTCMAGYPDCNPINQDIININAELLALQPVTVMLEVDPSNLTWMEMTVDATPFLNNLAARSYQEWLAEEVEMNPAFTPDEYNDRLTGVTEATFKVRVQEVATIATPDPAVTASVNDILDDFGRFGVSMSGYEILKDISMSYDQVDLTTLAGLATGGPVALVNVPDLFVPRAFDAELSTVNIVIEYSTDIIPVPIGVDFELDLKWIDGTDVYTEPLGLSDLIPLFLEGDIVSEAAYDTLVGYPDDTTYSLTKVWLLLASMDEEEEIVQVPN